MSEEAIKIDTPLGEVKIPFSELAILTLAKKLMKVSEGEPNLFEEAVVDFFGVNELEDTTLLQEASFWDEAQQHFLAESLAQYGDWSEVIDELDVRIRQSK